MLPEEPVHCSVACANEFYFWKIAFHLQIPLLLLLPLLHWINVLLGSNMPLYLPIVRWTIAITSFPFHNSYHADEQNHHNQSIKKIGLVCCMKGVSPFLNIMTATALWVKSGNRGILKCLKVNNNFELIFHRKMFIYFLGDAKLPKVYD